MTYYEEYLYRSKCPYLKDVHQIRIKYARLDIAEQLEPGYKKISYTCNHRNGCRYADADEFGNCPVFTSAPDDPR